MRISDDRIAAEVAEAERLRDEAVAEFAQLGLPTSTPLRLSERERTDADEALSEFQERLASGWYGNLDGEDE